MVDVFFVFVSGVLVVDVDGYLCIFSEVCSLARRCEHVHEFSVLLLLS